MLMKINKLTALVWGGLLVVMTTQAIDRAILQQLEK